MTRSAHVVERLLDWFARHQRDLPWRRTSDPYAVWISEVMLQQTQVRTVIPYWERWMRELPDVMALARAEESTVLKLWEGLGYYRRARYLQAAARSIVASARGGFPASMEELLELPGVGRYTAGAICSIAFNQDTPILDGNVTRVLSRLEAIPGDPRQPEVSRRLWNLAQALVTAAGRTGRSSACSHFNQAMMELGATVCLPGMPACQECPVSDLCQARKTRRPSAFPQVPPRARSTPRFFVVIVAGAAQRYCVRQRPVKGVNGGLWEFPNLEVNSARTLPEETARRLYGAAAWHLEPLTVVRHAITRYRVVQQVYRATLRQIPRAFRGAGQWLTLAELDPLAFTSAHRRILSHLQQREASAQPGKPGHARIPRK